ncbi:MAG: tRNA (adenosine(37)-N6)-threonylcarbamoyltransferase complex dimerization subunit type 1 TsaB [Pseudonocardiaceae bacterium]|nr:tRNA (adenosine(37)-N6)-threonylcarbamoyltransferase complex dimerization subunit type 1 TsaB [Pseudonocardiaceae bacterium]
MLVLALDTATPSVTAGVVELAAGQPTVLAERGSVDARAHGELLTPYAREALAEAGTGMRELDALVCGIGPGPFTGLRAGMVTAAALGHALGLPVYPVCSLDAIAAGVPDPDPLLVVTDARRREVYWASYAAGARTGGPHVESPATLVARELGIGRAAGHGARLYAEALGFVEIPPAYPSPAGLVRAAGAPLAGGEPPGALTPLYLRRPDAAEPGTRKRVSQP